MKAPVGSFTEGVRQLSARMFEDLRKRYFLYVPPELLAYWQAADPFDLCGGFKTLMKTS